MSASPNGIGPFGGHESASRTTDQQTTGSATATRGAPQSQPTAIPTTNAQPTQTNTVLPAQDYSVWTAQAGNIANNWTIIDNPATDGNSGRYCW